ncbi:EamA family transporter [Labrys wisconsinensis]|uniref:Inner membrane transporter RhtA n=1 Tax=Labrys wisconsinensis TaxID=425677 RepID=A0ABU0JL87_9HYPH|nr:EamA family transporter [Labrys wisconsinensis]MDQ0475055.1 inner membrane transporter RhtA [Labrys wisconsinensis]
MTSRDHDLAGRGAAPLGAVGALVGAMVSIQYGATLAKGLFATCGPEGTTVLRLAVGAVLLGILMRAWRARPSQRCLPALIGYGASLAAMNLLFYMALDSIPLGAASALQFAGPLALATLSSRRWVDLAWIAAAGLGLVLLSPLRSAAPLDPRGVLLALGAGAAWAFYIVLGRRVGRELGVQATAIGMLVATALVLPLGFREAGPGLLEPSILASALAVGVFSSALPFSLEMVALTRLPARTYGTLTSMEPVIGALLGQALLGETLTPVQWTGILAIAVAVLGTARTAGSP